jgi:hypothetical protein
MDSANPDYKYSELVSLRKIEAEFWSTLEKSLKQSKSLDNVNFKPLIKLQKSLNNVLLKMNAQIAAAAAAATPPTLDQQFTSMMIDVAEGPN